MADKAEMHCVDPWLIAQGAYCALNAGDTCLIGQYVSRMEAVLEKSRSVEYMLYCNLACLNDLFAGNAPSAFALAGEAVRAAREAGIPVGEALGRMLTAQAACEMGDHAIASHEINEAEDFFLSIGSSILEFSCELIKAYFAFHSGQEDDALEFVRVALRLGRQKGYTTAPYLWRRPVWSLLCAKALEAGIEVDYVHDLIRKQRLVPDGTAAQLENWPWPVKISVLGKFDLLVDGKPVRFSRKSQKKPLLMLKMLIALGGSEVKEEQLSDLLWPEADGDRAHSAFTTTLSRLRRLIGLDKAVEIHDGKASLNPRYCWVDVRAFEKIFSQVDPLLEGVGANVREQDRSHETILQLGDRAVGMYSGPLLPGEADESWVMPLRERLNSKFLRLIMRYGRHLETMERWEKAANCYRAASEMEEMIDEELYQRFMVCRQHLDHPARTVEVYRYSGTPAATQGRRPASKTETIYKNLILST
jgi:DNA-binding SARP family transcriptional activator